MLRDHIVVVFRHEGHGHGAAFFEHVFIWHFEPDMRGVDGLLSPRLHDIEKRVVAAVVIDSHLPVYP